jgi:hypothetical protein
VAVLINAAAVAPGGSLSSYFSLDDTKKLSSTSEGLTAFPSYVSNLAPYLDTLEIDCGGDGAIRSIDEKPFYECTALTSEGNLRRLQFDHVGDSATNNVLFIGKGAFSGCASIEDVSFSSSVSNNVLFIGKEAFYGCANLTGFVVDNNQTATLTNINPYSWRHEQ